jgi:SAM-dependent methyltransferase
MTTFDEAERAMWADTADAYQEIFAKLTAHTIPLLLDAAGVGPGVRVLDVGTGPGPVARAAADRGAAVTAVDAEPSMVALAAENVPEAEVVLAVLPDLPFEDASFDAVVGNFVLNHLGRPRTALAGLRRVAKPGALIAMTFWPARNTAGRSLKRRAFTAAGLDGAADLPALDPAEDYPRDEAGLAGLFREAGLRDVTTSVAEWDHRSTVEEWWEPMTRGMAAAGHTYLAQSPEDQAAIRRSYLELSREMLAEDGVTLVLDHLALLVVGTN